MLGCINNAQLLKIQQILEEEIKTMFIQMMESHTIEGEKVNCALDGLIEKVGMFAMEKNLSVWIRLRKISASMDNRQRMLSSCSRLSEYLEARMRMALIQ